VRELKAYFEYIAAETRRHFNNGVRFEVAAAKISIDRFITWLDPERIVINVASLYLEFSGLKEPPDRMALFAAMKRYRDAYARVHTTDAQLKSASWKEEGFYDEVYQLPNRRSISYRDN
jgi:cyclase